MYYEPISVREENSPLEALAKQNLDRAEVFFTDEAIQKLREEATEIIFLDANALLLTFEPEHKLTFHMLVSTKFISYNRLGRSITPLMLRDVVDHKAFSNMVKDYQVETYLYSLVFLSSNSDINFRVNYTAPEKGYLVQII